MPEWTWARAKCRGVSHIKTDVRCQDAVTCLAPTPGSLVAVVCDGAGSAAFGGEGASLTCRSIARKAADHLRAKNELPDDELLWSWTDEVREKLSRASANLDVGRKSFAATLVATIVTPTSYVALHIGDGAIVCRDSETGKWQTVSWPQHGDYASTTYFITDEPKIRMRITRQERNFDALAVFSDGIERLALSFSKTEPHGPFFDSMFRAVGASKVKGCDLDLSRKLASFLDSSQINARTDDDKSLILAVLK
jgi:serine/threonine protein phosphatase PrpC